MGIAKVAINSGAHLWAMNRQYPKWLQCNAKLQFESADFAVLNKLPEKLNNLLKGCSDLDLVILNSGMICKIKDMQETSMDEIQNLMNVNTWANKVLLDTLFALKIPIKQVVGISSGASVNGNRGWNAYSLSKSTLNMLIKLYADEVKDTHFTALAPGLIDSPMQDYLCGLPEDDRYQPLKILKSAKGTQRMPDSERAGKIIWEAIPKLLNYPSGSYVDVREM